MIRNTAAIACGAALLPVMGSCQKAKAPRPNIVIMIADDISMYDLGCYGHPVIKTPNIDALAADGVRFTNTFLTTSSSSPSRCSILTGRYPHNTGASELHTPLGDEQVTMAGVLHDAGYYTAQAGKWHFSTIEGRVVEDFDLTTVGKEKTNGLGGSDNWVQWLRERPADQPFFMWFASFDAHRGWDNDTSMPRYAPEDVVVPRFYVDNAATREDLASYYYEVSRFDASVGKVVAELKAQGIYDNSLIIVMADNGRPFPRAKTRMLPEGIKTPFVVRYPEAMKGIAGEVCNSLVSSIDVAPTVIAAAGLAPSPTFQGRSFLPLLADPEKPFRQYVFAEHNWHDYESYERMVCTADYLLIENKRPQFTVLGAIDIVGGGTGQSLLAAHEEGTLDDLQDDFFRTPRPEVELYLYEKDSQQTDNLAGKDASKAKELLDVLRRWQAETGDTTPDGLTADWYFRDSREKTPNHNIRGEQPGAAKQANLNNNPGPF